LKLDGIIAVAYGKILKRYRLSFNKNKHACIARGRLRLRFSRLRVNVGSPVSVTDSKIRARET